MSCPHDADCPSTAILPTPLRDVQSGLTIRRHVRVQRLEGGDLLVHLVATCAQARRLDTGQAVTTAAAHNRWESDSPRTVVQDDVQLGNPLHVLRPEGPVGLHYHDRCISGVNPADSRFPPLGK